MTSPDLTQPVGDYGLRTDSNSIAGDGKINYFGPVQQSIVHHGQTPHKSGPTRRPTAPPVR